VEIIPLPADRNVGVVPSLFGEYGRLPVPAGSTCMAGKRPSCPGGTEKPVKTKQLIPRRPLADNGEASVAGDTAGSWAILGGVRFATSMPESRC
jgi:hypothetical protein